MSDYAFDPARHERILDITKRVKRFVISSGTITMNNGVYAFSNRLQAGENFFLMRGGPKQGTFTTFIESDRELPSKYAISVCVRKFWSKYFRAIIVHEVSHYLEFAADGTEVRHGDPDDYIEYISQPCEIRAFTHEAAYEVMRKHRKSINKKTFTRDEFNLAYHREMRHYWNSDGSCRISGESLELYMLNQNLVWRYLSVQ